MDKFLLVKGGSGVSVVVSGKDRGVTRIAQTLVDDIRRIADPVRGSVRVIQSENVTTPGWANSSVIIIAGILGADPDYDRIAGAFEQECSAIRGKRECYFIKCATSVLTLGGKDVIYVFGSDKVGCEYGLLYLSSLMGVSPWHYWADVVPVKKAEIIFDPSDLDVVSREPSVEYRGFFLNDEWPSLGSFVSNTFGRFDENFYATVFDLLLRLRGNFLWPAMWAEVFGEDGTSYPGAIADLATELGITMGTSHHEPLFRAGEEFSYLMTESNETGYGKDWSYYTNERGIYKFWEDGVKRDKDHKALITIGMRGERDSLLLGENATMKDNVDLLRKAITDQYKILSDNGLADAPKVLALYKEVEDYYYGDAQTEGLCTWDRLDDALLLLSDDNFGNLRSVPDAATRDRKAGWGLYYHLDYHGDPISYEWVNSTPVRKVCDQMTLAYEYGIKRLWIVNVGDLRPVEMPLNFFMDLAYDIEKYGDPNKCGGYMREWAAVQFPEFDDEQLDSTSALLDMYTRFNGDRRPEATHPDTFSFTEENEASRELLRLSIMQTYEKAVAEKVPSECRDKYYGLVGFPVRASANLREMMILTGAYKLAAASGLAVANKLKDAVDKCIETDKELVRMYNEDMSGGKWKGMMSSKHVDFKHWNDEESEYPDIQYIETDDKSDMDITAYIESLSKPHGDCVTVLLADEFTDEDPSLGEWQLIDDYGRSGVSLKHLPATLDYDDIDTAPWVEYSFTAAKAGEYKITFFTAPSNNPFKGRGLKFGYSVDDGAGIAVDTLPEGFMAGYAHDEEWRRGVLDNCRRTTVSVNISEGEHTLRFYHLDAGVILQKIDIGPEESGAYYGYYRGPFA